MSELNLNKKITCNICKNVIMGEDARFFDESGKPTVLMMGGDSEKHRCACCFDGLDVEFIEIINIKGKTNRNE